MTNSKVSQPGQRSGKLWLPRLLLLAQFLTITPVLLIVFAYEQQRTASDGYVTLLDGLDRLSFAIAELEKIPPPAVKQAAVKQDGARLDGAAWQQQYSDYRGELNRTLAASATAPQIRETLARVDSIVTRMAKTESDLADLNKRPEQAEPLAAGFGKDGRAARSELLNVQRSVRLDLSTTGESIAQKTTYLKALVAGACMLAFGMVIVVRKFRVDSAIQVAAEVGPGPPVSHESQTAGNTGRERRAESRQGISFYPTVPRSADAGVAGIRVLDVSASGLRVAVPFALDLQTEVEIRIEGTPVVGIVRNCTRFGANEFHVGIQIPQAATTDEHSNHLRLLQSLRVI